MALKPYHEVVIYSRKGEEANSFPNPPLEKKKSRIKAFSQWFSSFALSFLLTCFLVVSLLYWPLAARKATFWWNSRYQPQAKVNDPTKLNLIIPPETLKEKNGKTDPSSLPELSVIPKENLMVVEKIDVNAPLIPIKEKEEEAVLKTIEKGIGYYIETGRPGKAGNFVVTGHSSYYWWKEGDFKFIFANLHTLPIGDIISVYWEGVKYDYRIIAKDIISPDADNVDFVFNQTDYQNHPILTIITCHPPGTAVQRLVVRAEQINPVFKLTEEEKVPSLPRLKLHSF